MAKRRALEKRRALSRKQSSSVEKQQTQLQKLLEKQKYRQALEKRRQIHQHHPEVTLTPSEASIWSLQGQEKFTQSQYQQAESSFRQALSLGLNGEAHYWLAKSLLALERPADALTEMRTAFETKVLPKDYAGCYLKLLLLQGETETVTQLLANQSKRFYAPQLHWARGMLELKAGRSDTALKHFQKMGRPATPDDRPMAWLAFAHQQAENWEQAERVLGMRHFSPFSRMGMEPVFTQHPALQSLAITQAIATDHSLTKFFDLDERDIPKQSAVLVLMMLEQINQNNIHEAAHITQKFKHPCQDFPEIDQLYTPLLLLAGEQAMQVQQPECAQKFWGPVLQQLPFDPHLAFKMHCACRDNMDDRASQRWLNKLLDWVKQTAKQHPKDWPDRRLNSTLAHLHCLISDSWMLMRQPQKCFRVLQQAERLYPELPEVIGRLGLKAQYEGHHQQAIPLLQKALEKGCCDEIVYSFLIECLEDQGDQKRIKETRRRFGKQFGDLSGDLEIDIPAWIDAFSTQTYSLFKQLVRTDDDKNVALQACRLFVSSVEDGPNQSGRVTLGQAQATQQWNQLLEGLPPQKQIPVLQAISLSLQLFTKRKKGIAALQTQYLQQLFALSGQYPEATVAHLVLLVVKEQQPEKLKVPLHHYLDTSSQPGIALAQVQLQARRFTQTAVLRPTIDQALKHDPQNAQLLLAKATTFPLKSNDYQQYKEKGFDLARRLQNPQALQAFREEEAFQAVVETKALRPNLSFNGPGGLDINHLLQQMAHQMFGEEVPPEILEQMMPELQRLMTADLSNLEEEFFDDDDIFVENGFFELDPLNAGLPFGQRQSTSKKRTKRKRGFQS